MSRNSRHDPVSKRALRRMAYQVNRPGVRAVLHDALLETFPEYARKIEFAERLAKKDHHPYIIMFNPQALKRGSDRAGNVYEANRFAVFNMRPHRFLTFRSHLSEFISRLRSENYPDHVLVYIAGLKRKKSPPTR